MRNRVSGKLVQQVFSIKAKKVANCNVDDAKKEISTVGFGLYNSRTSKLEQTSTIMTKLDFKKLILSFRGDLRRRFITSNELDEQAFFSWLVTSGIKEYPSLLMDRSLCDELKTKIFFKNCYITKVQAAIYNARLDLQSIFTLPEKKNEFLAWFDRHGIDEYDLSAFLIEPKKNILANQVVSALDRVNSYKSGQLRLIKNQLPNRKFGVNLIGYVYGQLGIGEDLRMLARALIVAGVPISLLNFKPGENIPQNDFSMSGYVSNSGDYAINIFCMTAEEQARFYIERGGDQFVGRYNIGYWPWELSVWPKEWLACLDLVDEVWVSTKHIYDSLLSVCNKPLYVMPLTVELGDIRMFSSRSEARGYFGLPESPILFCFAFDQNSYVERKNPQGCIDAFKKAFPVDKFDEQKVGLVIKVHALAQEDATLEKLKKFALTDRRIYLIASTLSRPDLLALYKTCDCFISMHRAEGFGRCIAEALELGLHVICTGYSGNVDFCRGPQCDLVKYKLIPIMDGQYPYCENQVWADPDIDHAAFLMRQYFEKSGGVVALNHWPQFSALENGRVYKARLLRIFHGCNFLAHK